MNGENEFRKQIQQLGTLIGELEQLPENSATVIARQLVQLLMSLHGTGLERTLEIVFETSGPAAIDKLAADAMVNKLLLLHSLHPDDMETRVRDAVTALRPRLGKLDCEVELVGIEEGAVRLHLKASAQACGSTKKNLRTMAEEAIYDAAPDIGSLEISGLEEPRPGGFVSLEKLMGSALRPQAGEPLLTVESGD